MSLVKLTYTHDPREEHSGWSLALDTIQDLQLFVNIDHQNASESGWDMWKELKDGKAKDAYHCSHGKHSITNLLAMHLENPNNGKDTSLVEFSNKLDSIMIGKYKIMERMIHKGQSVRVNHKGGYSQLDDFFTVLEEVKCNKDTLMKFLSTGDVTPTKLTINKEILVIENDDAISESFAKSINHLINKYQIINRFKTRIKNYTSEELVKLFVDGLNNKLTTIYVETTLQDKEQLESMQATLEAATKIANKSLTVNINVSSGEPFKVKTIDLIKVNITYNL